jgi:hypothetical protein
VAATNAFSNELSCLEIKALQKQFADLGKAGAPSQGVEEFQIEGITIGDDAASN